MVLVDSRSPIFRWVFSRMAHDTGHKEEPSHVVGAHGCYEMGYDYDAVDYDSGHAGDTSRR